METFNEQASMSLTWLGTLKTGFLVAWPLYVRKPGFGGSDHARLKQACSATATSNFACNKLDYISYQIAKNKGTDQPIHSHRLVFTFVVRLQ